MDATAFGIVMMVRLRAGTVGVLGNLGVLVGSSMFISCVQYCRSNSFLRIRLKLDVPEFTEALEMTLLETELTLIFDAVLESTGGGGSAVTDEV